jgi:short-subunit dehydrogenase
MRRHLERRVAIVTGASSGVGWQTAQRLAEAGASVCVTARRLEPLQDLCRLIEFVGGKAHAVACDVTDDAQVRRVVDECIERFGHVDVLVNNAAVQAYGYFDQLEWEAIQRTFDVNAFGAMRFARAVLPHFRKQGTGHIVNVASLAGRAAGPNLATYCATKHGVVGLSEAVRAELRGTGVEVTVVMPGYAKTELASGVPDLRGVKRVTPEEIAEAIVAALKVPRFDVWAPRRLGLVVGFGAMLPRRWREAVSRAMNSEGLARTDQRKRASYEARAAASAPAADEIIEEAIPR